MKKVKFLKLLLYNACVNPNPYYSSFRPKLEYANSAWYPYLQKDKYKFYMVNSKLLDVVLKKERKKERKKETLFKCLIF